MCVAATHCEGSRGAFHTPAQPLRPIIAKADALALSSYRARRTTPHAPAANPALCQALLTAASRYASLVPSRTALTHES